MSFIYSRALVAAFSQASYSGTDAYALSSGSHTPKPCLWHDRTMEPSRLSRFGMTCKPLMEGRGEELLTLWRAGFHAKTLAQQEKAQALTVSAAECGRTWPASLAKYDPDTSSWRTAQYSLLGGLDEFSETWPKWGSMQSGECWERPTLVPLTSESASGLWQTPVADDAANRANGKWNSRGGPKLSAQVLYPTPCANSHTGAGHGPNKTGAPNLQTVVAQRTYPTATATAFKGWSPNHNRANTDDRLDYTVERDAFTHGQQTPPMRLNPDWVEWLMGWPIGHTALKPLETGKYQEWLSQHGAPSLALNKD